MFPRTRALPTRPAIAPWKILLPALVLLALGWWGYRWLTRPVNPPLQAAAQQGTVAGDWAALRTFGPRAPSTPGHARTLEWAAAHLTALGYRVTRQPFEVTVLEGLGAEVRVGGQVLRGHTLWGAQGGEQEARLVRIPPDATTATLERLQLLGQLAVTTCPAGRWAALADAVVDAGGLGLAIVNDCAQPPKPSRVDGTTLPLLELPAQDGAALLRQVGQTVMFTTRTRTRTVTASNLLAARVDSTPDVLFGAHLDSVPGSPGANDNASGVLAVLHLARQAAGTPLAERAWFVLFDDEETGINGSRLFAQQYSPSLRHTRAVLNLDMVGVAAQPLGVAAHEDLRALVRRVQPDVRLFEDEPVSTRETFGRSLNLTGRSDHAAFKVLRIRTLFLHRGEDPAYHSPRDRILDPVLVEGAADLAKRLADAALEAPFTMREPCGITGRNCR
ncbi:M28 family metallopeptidase [Deinococcus sp. HMF7604]|uniref:M28 family metallopeptidase n=1 Tax=Deinococcus betulae TaxID=2873312 RepID=UPI001CCC3CC8|nr:M28 family metallopeptidase [Deinococcus betulae]MBZ9749585.1 M28 family metallopeptidase [Deinococcus betulae]